MATNMSINHITLATIPEDDRAVIGSFWQQKRIQGLFRLHDKPRDART
jgi:hypothetical protein